MNDRRRFLGVYLNGLDLQNEGIDAPLDAVEAAGATAVALVPTLARPAENGVRYPDLHVDGTRRVVARPAWGRTELPVRYYRAVSPDERFRDLKYRPPSEEPPPDIDRSLVPTAVAAARRRGLEVHTTISPLLVPGLRDEDRPRLVDGSVDRKPRIADNACLNAPDVRVYGRVLAEATIRRLDGVDGLIPDWIEFGAYHFPDLFGCFCSHCFRAAATAGIDLARAQHDVRLLWDRVHALDSRDLATFSRLLARPVLLAQTLTNFPGIVDLLRFKAHSVRSFYAEVRDALAGARPGAELQVGARGWPPPWNLVSGMDYGALTDVVLAAMPKLFFFDYAAVPRWYGETLRSWNAGLDESALLDAMVDWLDLPDERSPRQFADYQIPAPDAAHPVGVDAYRRRVQDVLDRVMGRVPVRPIAHAYLPEPQWRETVDMLRDTAVDGIWVHMYAYLSDAKLAVLQHAWR